MRVTNRDHGTSLCWLVLVGAISAGGPPVNFVQAAVPQDDQMPVLVGTDWVAQHKDDADVLLVHVAMLETRPPEAYIPGAVSLDYHAIETSEGLAVELPSPQELLTVFRAVGVSNDQHVILYSGAALISARAFVTLEYLGHPRVSVMDGGIAAWLDDGRETSDKAAEADAGDFVPQIDGDVLADAEWILARLEDPNVAVIDARPASQYAGESTRGPRSGHIPGAGNLYYVELLRSEEMPRLKPRDEVEALFAAAGGGPGKTLVSYCQIGMRASYNYLIARHLGYEVKFYDQSWQEWGAREDLPAETGQVRD